jgi:hypothetical protein
MDQRHGRQSRLADVGSAGQQRIAAATVVVRCEGLAGEVATRYLAGAGVGSLRVPSQALAAIARSVDPAIRVELAPGDDVRPEQPGDDVRPEQPGDDLDFRDPAARELALGAREALRALRAVLEGAS